MPEPKKITAADEVCLALTQAEPTMSNNQQPEASVESRPIGFASGDWLAHSTSHSVTTTSRAPA